MATLSCAQLFVALLPFGWWRRHLGLAADSNNSSPAAELQASGRRFARQVDRGAERLPMHSACLVRAMALSWILRAKEIPHVVVFAVRPSDMRQSADALHAWVEVHGNIVLGELSGPWLQTLRLGE
jgi:hypothetical protein